MSNHLLVRWPERDGSFFKGPIMSARKRGREMRKAAALVVPKLTSRENEVLHWIAEGKRDREIGTILNCSSRTVQKHVQNVLEKLQVETRGAAAAWWHDYPH